MRGARALVIGLAAALVAAACGGAGTTTPSTAPTSGGAAATATADPNTAVAAFYQGKTIRVIVGLAAGGGFDTTARLLARHMGKYIPGNPTLVVENMPGAGSRVAANWLYEVGEKDGTVFGVFNDDDERRDEEHRQRGDGVGLPRLEEIEDHDRQHRGLAGDEKHRGGELAHRDDEDVIDEANRHGRWIPPASGRFETVDDLEGALIAGPPSYIAEVAEGYHAAGCEHLVFDLRFRFDEWLECVQLLDEEVLPLLRRPGARP